MPTRISRQPDESHAKAIEDFYADKTIQWFLEKYTVKYLSDNIWNIKDESGESPRSVIEKASLGSIVTDYSPLNYILSGIVFKTSNDTSIYSLHDPETLLTKTMPQVNYGPYMKVYTLFGFITAIVTFNYYSIPNIFYKEIWSGYRKTDAQILIGGKRVTQIVKGIMERSMVWFTSGFSQEFFGCVSPIFVLRLDGGLFDSSWFPIPISLCFIRPGEEGLKKITNLSSPSCGRIHFYEEEAKKYRLQLFEKKFNTEMNRIIKLRETTQRMVEILKEAEERALWLDVEIMENLDLSFEDVYPNQENTEANELQQ